jgi:hypothetical protein
MEINPSRETASCAASQEIPNILFNPKVHYRVHNGPSLVRIQDQINPVYTAPSNLSIKSVLTIFAHLCLGLLSGLFPSGFPTYVVYSKSKSKVK